MRSTSVITVLLIIAFASGCAVGPNYHPPRTTNAPAFAEINPDVNTNAPIADWWREFHDPELDHLISEALRSNYDLQIAAVRIRESRFQRNLIAADLFPVVDADASYIHARGSQNVALPLGGGSSSSQGSQSQASVPRIAALDSSDGGSASGNDPAASSPLTPFGKGGLPGVTSDLYQVGFDASWEIDVFGGQRRRVEAATGELAAARESRRDLQVSVAAEVAHDYLELRGTQERLKIARANLAAQNDILALTKSKRSVGLATELDVARATAQIEITAATVPPLEGESKRLVHSLSTLIGMEPGEFAAELDRGAALPPAPPQIPVGLPSQLVRRRADIRMAERQIAAANARIGVAEADLFPKFELIGGTGLDSSSTRNLFDWESRYFLISPTVTWRIFDAGHVLNNIGVQKAGREEADLQYRNTVLKALREVEDALVGYATERVRQNHLEAARRQNEEALDLAQKRYDQGLDDFLIVLDAERSVYSAQDACAQSNQSMLTSLVALYKSLGGGWE